ncbi:hypothetical protein FH972_026608 [Carpinus fangiana]|uniref:PPM-type phosphatase domain-containing protein n=1 Tax=Carpinus fangiana TaxID=176857 RepID=A0A5N6L4W1_9ROSI|nr:hypothetical protein FH972_026608 [Carpinus fangiana]
MLARRSISRALRAPKLRQSHYGLRHQHDSTAPRKSARRPGVFSFVIFGGVAYGAGYYLNKKPDDKIDAVDHTQTAAAQRGPAHTLDSATALIRAAEESRTFGNPRTTGGHFHSTHLASNSPIEDRSDVLDAMDAGWQLWGVYDGHAGWATADLLQHNLPASVVEALKNVPGEAPPESLDETVKRVFTDFDAAILDPAAAVIQDGTPDQRAASVGTLAPALAGSCALLAIFSPVEQSLRVACVGDSRAVLGRAGSGTDALTTIHLSEDQTGFNASERARIEAAHPGESPIDPKEGRILGIAVSRAFGDSRFKWTSALQTAAKERYWGFKARPAADTPPYLTAEPVITSTKVERGDFLILASDGLWDNMRSEDAVKCVAQWREAKRTGKLRQNWQQRAETGSEEKEFVGEWKATSEHFVFEDDNAATCLVKNALGGRRRGLFTGVMSLPSSLSRDARDDITVQVIFFDDEAGSK